jgi:hypothetical protein
MWIAPAAAASMARARRVAGADGDKYKVTDDGDMKARAIWRENPALPAKAATSLAQEKYHEKYAAFWFALVPIARPVSVPAKRRHRRAVARRWPNSSGYVE